ncbi:hypothetical protein ESCO_000959 [Escovopsis weberi]|uniref:Uncharacterized protein n=1 Tax=Escovopsis weberi TaxID=150374 RepID=A0A0M8N411_ESCWE|nr:hypothetical protein ESCO_000959 [Escovopsis weberi]
MDEALITQLLSSFLPPDLVALVEKNMLRPNSPGQVLYRHSALVLRRGCDAAVPLLRPVLDRALLVLAAHQSYVDAAVPLLLLVAVVMVMNWMRRLAVWCARLVLRATLWACVVALGAWVYRRGVLESARDAAVVGGKVAGYVAVLRDVWVDEYRRYEGAQATGRWDEFSHAGAAGSTRY